MPIYITMPIARLFRLCDGTILPINAFAMMCGREAISTCHTDHLSLAEKFYQGDIDQQPAASKPPYSMAPIDLHY
jgi:hypothetical protein